MLGRVLSLHAYLLDVKGEELGQNIIIGYYTVLLASSPRMIWEWLQILGTFCQGKCFLFNLHFLAASSDGKIHVSSRPQMGFSKGAGRLHPKLYFFIFFYFLFTTLFICWEIFDYKIMTQVAV